jgi:hypothetical protein
VASFVLLGVTRLMAKCSSSATLSTSGVFPLSCAQERKSQEKRKEEKKEEVSGRYDDGQEARQPGGVGMPHEASQAQQLHQLHLSSHVFSVFVVVVA